MDDKKVLRYLYKLRTIKYDEKHIYDCLLEQTIADAEQEIATGGWRPGTEPPPPAEPVNSTPIIEIAYLDGGKPTRTYGKYFAVNTRWIMVPSGGLILPNMILGWRYLPPLPAAAEMGGN